MGTIHRVPVFGQALPRALACQGAPCVDLRLNDKTFTCPNHEKTNPGGCQTRAFLYPRGKGADGFHYHQGIDIAREAGLDIVAVIAGEVVEATHAWTPGFSGYGKVVVLHGVDNRYYLHAHCQDVFVKKGERVREKQRIATTGDTFFTREKKTELLSHSAPHLHFEVSREPYPKAARERTPEGENRDVREDPLLVLEQLGPWGAGRSFFLPNGLRASGARIEALQRAIETSTSGGYFPVGANNFWHGGVHLPMAAGSVIKAPLAGRIVAARLDEDPLYAHRDYGSTNFVLMRHELSAEVVQQFKAPPSPALSQSAANTNAQPAVPATKRSVGAKSSTNSPEDVREVARMLHAITQASSNAPYWPSDAPPASGDDPAFIRAIEEYQRDLIAQKGYKWPPDGVVRVNGVTWNALRDEAGPATAPDDAAAAPSEAPPSDPPTTPVWSLFMHVGAAPFDQALAHKIPWLGAARAARSAEEEEQDAATTRETHERYERDKAEFDASEQADAAEAHAHTLLGSVGVRSQGAKRTPQQNFALDVLWVKARLTRFGFFQGEPNPEIDEHLVSAIRAFQAAHVPSCKGQGDGYLTLRGQTRKRLQMTRAQLGLITPPKSPAAQQSLAIDERFVAPFRTRGALDVTDIVTDLDIALEAGAPVWTSGHGGSQGDGLAEHVHWEMFSEQPLFTWDTLDDPDDDLSLDACNKLMAAIDEGEGVGQCDGVLTRDEVARFYASDAALAVRRLQCRFRGEWAVEPAAVRAAAAKLDVEFVGEVEDIFGPYTLWNTLAAQQKVPSSPHVWRYNPASFLGEYARIAGASKGDLRVEVYVNGERAVDAEVVLSQRGKSARPMRSSRDGRVRFEELLPGAYLVEAYTHGGIHDADDVIITEGEITTLILGEPPKRDLFDLDNPFVDYKRMRLTMCREGLGDVTLSPHLPKKGKSGVTLGYGFDIGGRTEEAVRSHLQAIALPETCIASLLPAVGLTLKNGAHAWFDANRAQLGWKMHEDQRFSLLERIYPEYEAQARSRAQRFTPSVTEAQYDALHWYVRELVTDLTYVGATYSTKNSTAHAVNTILADAQTDDAAKLRALRMFVGTLSVGLQAPAGRKWRERYIDAALADLEREP